MPRLHSRRIHSEQRSFAFTVGERRLGGRRTWRRSGEQQHPARISAAATGDSGPHLRSGDRRLCRQGSSSSSAPRMAGPRPPRVGPPLLLLALGMAVGGGEGVMEGGGGGRWAPTLPRSGAASLFYWPVRGGASVGAGGSHFFFFDVLVLAVDLVFILYPKGERPILCRSKPIFIGSWSYEL